MEKKITKVFKEIKSENRKATKSFKEIHTEEKILVSELKSEEKTKSANEIKSAEKKPTKSPRRRFFFTPGKSPITEGVKKKKEYFPQIEYLVNNQSPSSLGKSPRTPEVRKHIYENVRSPVAEYIKGTDVKLVKNIFAKTNDWLLTPQPLGVINESNDNRHSPLKSVQESAALKFNLSPMRKKVRELCTNNYFINLRLFTKF